MKSILHILNRFEYDHLIQAQTKIQKAAPVPLFYVPNILEDVGEYIYKAS